MEHDKKNGQAALWWKVLGTIIAAAIISGAGFLMGKAKLEGEITTKQEYQTWQLQELTHNVDVLKTDDTKQTLAIHDVVNDLKMMSQDVKTLHDEIERMKRENARRY